MQTARLTAALALTLSLQAAGTAASAPLAEQARGQRFDELTGLLTRDFAGQQHRLAEYHALALLPVPNRGQPTRLATYLTVLARGREAQRRPVAAFAAWFQLSRHAGSAFLAVPGDPGLRLRADRLARGRIAELFARAAPGQRKLLDEAVARLWQEARGQGPEALRPFIAAFGPSSPTGRQARLERADHLSASGYSSEADLLYQDLLQSGDPPAAARALRGLARMLTRPGLLADAFHYYQALGHDYPRVEVEGKNTGADLLGDLAADRRFLP